MRAPWLYDDEEIEDVIIGEAEADEAWAPAIDGSWPEDEDGAWTGPYQNAVADETMRNPTEGTGALPGWGRGSPHAPELDPWDTAAEERWLAWLTIGA